MEEKYELLEHVHKDATMAVYTLKKLMTELKDKDNHIKGSLEEILHKYEKYATESKEILEKNGIHVTEENGMAKMMSAMGIKKEVNDDNSDASMASMLIQGISMGSLEMEKKLKDYHGKMSKENEKLAKNFCTFQQHAISGLKNYL